MSGEPDDNMILLLYVVFGLAVIVALDMCRRLLPGYQLREKARILDDSRNSYVRAMAGLRAMAGVVSQLNDAPQNLSRQGIGLLDTYAKAVISFRYLARDLRTMSHDRAMRHLTRELLKLESQEAVLSQFQTVVLRVVSVQGASETVAPPVPVRRYRAAFTVLRHDLPREVWPVMDEVLAAGVRLKVMDADQLKVPEIRRIWTDVPTVFVNGGRAVFNRKYLERAVALRMVIFRSGHAPRVFDYNVEHELPIRPARKLWWGGPSANMAGKPAHNSRSAPVLSQSSKPNMHRSIITKR